MILTYDFFYINVDYVTTSFRPQTIQTELFLLLVAGRLFFILRFH